MNSDGIYKLRPAGRHILTIGRDLIQDNYAAVVELVKNAYDADSPDVHIGFHAKPDHSKYFITITDHGHGMSPDTVTNKWMVPSTRHKLDKKYSPGGRAMQGSKGIGRYAASILGTDLLLETVSHQGEKTTLLVEWNTFETAQYLDDVEILIETTRVSDPPGTRLSMTGDSKLFDQWDKKQFEKLRFELKKLIFPLNTVISKKTNNSEFCITLEIKGFPDIQDTTEAIEPYPLFDLFDYQISGRVNTEGNGIFTYSLQKARNTPEEQIQFDLGSAADCGELVFDIRVYDREKESIESLADRSAQNDPIGKLQVRQLLNEYNGIGVYRNGFRIRPLGDADFDWLKLNERRVQNPSLRIGSNQVIGYVQIQSEEMSGLVEKSARDGLRENSAFEKLKQITQKVISELEVRRFEYRKKAGLGRSAYDLSKRFDQLFSSEILEKNIRFRLLEEGLSQKAIEGVTDLISQDTEKKNKVVDEIHQAVAIYQGQATLGKIMNVILHEGRRPLSYFRNQIPNLHYWHDSLQKAWDTEKLTKLMRSIKGIGENAEFLVSLFHRLDPLAAGKRSNRGSLNLKKTIRNSLAVFTEEMKTSQITVELSGPDDFCFLSWQQDIYAIFTNLMDNSIYWMNEKKTERRKIIIEMVIDNNTLSYIDYRDTGPGIESHLIASEVIFEPQFSTKLSGTGLGLAIAGEAALRNGLELKALESERGAWFRLQLKGNEEHD